jgi:uroporphyrinogen-III synthase
MGALAGRRIVVPETREIEVLAGMLERHGAEVIRCPLVAIRDADPAPIMAWLQRFVTDAPNDLVLFTGEGLQRLNKLAEADGLSERFVATLARVRKITRGPKPARRLRELGLKPDLPVEPPTTAGIIACLRGENLASHRIAVQLYPDNPHTELLEFLAGAARSVDPIVPYAYASAAEEARVAEVIDAMAAGDIDLIAFTSAPQLRRLRAVARARDCEAALAEGFAKTKLAAVGPVVAAAIEAAGGTVAVAPTDNFHMRPMVNAIVEALGSS